MRRVWLVVAVFFTLAAALGCAMVVDPAAAPMAAGMQTEPDAGQWQTWVLASVESVAPPAPPDAAATQAEMATIKEMVAAADAAALQQIAYWNAGAPNYRWIEIALAEHATAGIGPTPRLARNMALLNTAIYDAMVAAWQAKYTWQRPQPALADATLVPLIAAPNSPSYPSEHAVAAGAAAAVLAHLFPERADALTAMAEEAANSRVMAGVHYPSDVAAGLELGRAVAAEVIAFGQADGSDLAWDGMMNSEPGHWTGENPVQPTAGAWRTWVLASGDQLRPPPPPAWDSEQMQVELDALKAITPTFTTRAEAFFWQSPRGTSQYFYSTPGRLIFEHGLADNAPEAARIYAAASVALADAFIGCYDAKYAYWSMRPNMVDPELPTLFPNPNFPSYPSAHSCVSTALATVLGSIFPDESERLMAAANAAGDSRMYAGIHFQSDLDAGEVLGAAVGELVIQRLGEMQQP